MLIRQSLLLMRVSHYLVLVEGTHAGLLLVGKHVHVDQVVPGEWVVESVTSLATTFPAGGEAAQLM